MVEGFLQTHLLVQADEHIGDQHAFGLNLEIGFEYRVVEVCKGADNFLAVNGVMSLAIEKDVELDRIGLLVTA